MIHKLVNAMTLRGQAADAVEKSEAVLEGMDSVSFSLVSIFDPTDEASA